MGRLVVGGLMVAVVICAYLAATSAEGEHLGYGAIGKGNAAPLRGQKPSDPQNKYKRGCSPGEKCRQYEEEDSTLSDEKAQKEGDNFIGTPALGKGGAPDDTPKGRANDHQRGCSPINGCRTNDEKQASELGGEKRSGKFIGNPAMGKGGAPDDTPKERANDHQRGCSPGQGCRTNEEKQAGKESENKT